MDRNWYFSSFMKNRRSDFLHKVTEAWRLKIDLYGSFGKNLISTFLGLVQNRCKMFFEFYEKLTFRTFLFFFQFFFQNTFILQSTINYNNNWNKQIYKKTLQTNKKTYKEIKQTKNPLPTYPVCFSQCIIKLEVKCYL